MTDTAELTLSDIFEEISEQLASARTKKLLGEHQEALLLFQTATVEFERFRESLRPLSGYHALEYAFKMTLEVFIAEQLPTPKLRPMARNVRRRGKR